MYFTKVHGLQDTKTLVTRLIPITLACHDNREFSFLFIFHKTAVFITILPYSHYCFCSFSSLQFRPNVGTAFYPRHAVILHSSSVIKQHAACCSMLHISVNLTVSLCCWKSQVLYLFRKKRFDLWR